MPSASFKPRPVRGRCAAALVVGLAALAAGEPLRGGGFALAGQSGKAAGMAGAVVAQAEDPTAAFHNPGALALAPAAPKLSAGFTVLGYNESLYQGRPPGVGTGTTAEQQSFRELVPHAFVGQAVGQRARLGFGVYTPFRLDTRWAAPDAYAGRYSAVEFGLETLDLSFVAATRLGDGFGIGAGVVYRTSDLELRRRVPSFDPLAGRVVDVASQSIQATQDDGFGWTVGFQHRRGAGFSWGVAYRSAITIDYSGTGVLAQIESGNPLLDELIAATLPLDQDLAFASRIEFPDELTVGLAVHPGARATVELDVSLMGWSGLRVLELRFPNNPELDASRFQGLSDTTGYRLGGSIETHGGTVFRAGVSFEESPQPDAALGALWVDGDRTGYHAGLSRDWLDVGLVWQDLADRLVTDSADGLNGAYNGSRWLLVVTINK